MKLAAGICVPDGTGSKKIVGSGGLLPLPELVAETTVGVAVPVLVSLAVLPSLVGVGP